MEKVCSVLSGSTDCELSPGKYWYRQTGHPTADGGRRTMKTERFLTQIRIPSTLPVDLEA